MSHKWQRLICKCQESCIYQLVLVLSFTVDIYCWKVQAMLDFWTSHSNGRPCQKEIWICVELRSDVGYCVLCFTDFEAQTLPTYNTHIIPTLTRLSCDEQLHWDRNYSTNIHSLPHQKPPPWAGPFEGFCVQERYVVTSQRSEINQTLIIRHYCCLGTGS
jgi:hypothetical protein